MKRIFVPAFVFIALGCGGSHHDSPPSTTPAPSSIARTILATGLTAPVQYVSASSHLAYVLELGGRVRAMVDDVLAETPVLDLTGTVFAEGECGLLGMTLAPDFKTSRAFYLHYDTRTAALQVQTRIARYTMADDGLSASGDGIVATIDQPYFNHKGGAIHFGGDGLLYLATGDGGDANDPQNRAQDPQSLLGKVLRIDPSGDDFPADADNNYRVPSDNPFVGVGGVRGEIWDFGMRNPFRWTVDAKTKALILADVGQVGYEEVDFEPAGKGGRNYGWRVREGYHPSGNQGPLYAVAVTEPFLEYDHSIGSSITGGFVVRGSTLGVKDRYLFGDYIANKLWTVPLPLASGEAQPVSIAARVEIPVAGGWDGIVSIDPDANGEPIVTEINVGRISRLVPVP